MLKAARNLSLVMACAALALAWSQADAQSGIRDGMLLQERGKTAVYVVEHGVKRPFGTSVAFLGLGYSWDKVKAYDDLSYIPTGPLINTSLQRHVRGSVVVGKGSDKAVYFMGTTQRYPFPSWDVYAAWGLTSADILPANSYDFQLPIGPAIEYPAGHTQH